MGLFRGVPCQDGERLPHYQGLSQLQCPTNVGIRVLRVFRTHYSNPPPPIAVVKP